MKNLLLLCSLVVTLSGCTPNEKQSYDPFTAIDDEKVKSTLSRAIDVAGGWESWSSIERITYVKRGVLLEEDGSVESDVTQRHVYQMQPQFTADISWSVGADEHQILFQPDGCIKKINGTIQDVDEQSLAETVMSSLYVLGMPFKLLDPGTKLQYSESVQLNSGKKADVIKATYSPDDYDNHSTIDEWYYYFDQENGDFLGCMVYHAPTYAYIENLEFYQETPVKFHKHRRSYRSDSARNIQFLRAEFWYSDYDIKMVTK